MAADDRRREIEQLRDDIVILRAEISKALDSGAGRHVVLALAEELRELQDRLAELGGFPHAQ